MSSVGVGSLAGALSIAFIGRLPAWHLVLGAALALGLLEILPAVGVDAFPIVLLLPILAGGGISMTTASAMANTRIQAISPDPLRGRVMSVYTTIFTGTSPFGALLASGIANGIGTPGSLAISRGHRGLGRAHRPPGTLRRRSDPPGTNPAVPLESGD